MNLQQFANKIYDAFAKSKIRLRRSEKLNLAQDFCKIEFRHILSKKISKKIFLDNLLTAL